MENVKKWFKPTKTTYQSQVEFYQKALAYNQKAGNYYYLLSSDWTTGKGRYTKRKAVPYGIIEVEFTWRHKDSETKAESYALELIKKKHPRCKIVLLMKKSLVAKAFKALNEEV